MWKKNLLRYELINYLCYWLFEDNNEVLYITARLLEMETCQTVGENEWDFVKGFCNEIITSFRKKTQDNGLLSTPRKGLISGENWICCPLLHKCSVKRFSLTSTELRKVCQSGHRKRLQALRKHQLYIVLKRPSSCSYLVTFRFYHFIE